MTVLIRPITIPTTDITITVTPTGHVIINRPHRRAEAQWNGRRLSSKKPTGLSESEYTLIERVLRGQR